MQTTGLSSETSQVELATAKSPSLLIPFAAGHCANDLAPVGMYLIIPAFGAAHGLSPPEIGLLFTIHSLGAALAYLPAGIATDQVINRGLLLLSTFFWVGIGYTLASFAGGYWTFAALIAIAGAGDAAWHPVATGILTRLHSRKRAYALGMHAIGGHLAEVGGLILTGYLLAHFDWQTCLRIISIPALLMGLVFLFIIRRIPRGQGKASPGIGLRETWSLWATWTGLRVVALFTFYNMALFAMLAMTPVFLQKDHGFDWRDTALVLAMMMVLGALAQPVMGRISDAIGRRPLLVWGNAIAAAAAVFACFSPSLVWTLVSLGIAMTVLVGIRAVVLAVAVDHSEGQEGTSLGLAFAFMDGVGATAAVFAGIVGHDDLQYAFLLAGIFSIIATLLAWFRLISASSVMDQDVTAKSY